MDEQLRNAMSEHGITIWLRADIDLLVKRTKYRSRRPLLNKGDTREILTGLMTRRYPVYAKSEIIIDVSEEPASKTALRIINLLTNHNPEEDNQ